MNTKPVLEEHWMPWYACTFCRDNKEHQSSSNSNYVPPFEAQGVYIFNSLVNHLFLNW